MESRDLGRRLRTVRIPFDPSADALEVLKQHYVSLVRFLQLKTDFVVTPITDNQFDVSDPINVSKNIHEQRNKRPQLGLDKPLVDLIHRVSDQRFTIFMPSFIFAVGSRRSTR